MRFLDITHTVTHGSLILALPIAVAAGLISFLSPCVLPLIPGYLSYITGVVGTDVTGGKGTGAEHVTRQRAFLGTVVFVSGFTFIFVSYGALFGGVGRFLIEFQRPIQLVSGFLVIILGASFLGGVPFLQRQWTFAQRPSGTVSGAFVLGAVFGLGWTPCIGPTLAAVQTLAINEGSAWRGALLSAAYCAGLGIPFLIIGQMLKTGISTIAFLRRHSRLITQVGGCLLIVIGLLLVTGYWNTLTINLRVWLAEWSVTL